MSLRPAHFFLPAFFLLALGLGNIGVGSYKMEEYEQVAKELALLEPSQGLVHASPLQRIQLASDNADRILLRQRHVNARKEYYRLVSFGGKLLLYLGLLLLSVGTVLTFSSASTRH